MLSRTADSLFWIARHAERAEYLARILDGTMRPTNLPLAYVGTSNEWKSAVATAGNTKLSKTTIPRPTKKRSFISWRYRPKTLLDPQLFRNGPCQRSARYAPPSLRKCETINTAWIELQRFGNGPGTREETTRFLRWVQETSLRFDGSAYRTMLRNDSYWFTRLGLYIERADNTARILDVKYHLLLPRLEPVGGSLDYFQWAAILRSVSALTAYHWVYRESVKPWLVADLLILNDQMPRSLANCYENLVRYLDEISGMYGRQGPAQRQARIVHTRLEQSRMEEIFQHGLHEFINSFIADNNSLGAAISQQYLM
jgi:uncharacterized alpha-E superfamily protein